MYRETLSLDWDNCVRYSSDNTNSMIGQRNSLLQKIRGVEGDQKIFALGCLCHLANLCAGKGDNKLSVNVENFVMGIYHNFPRSEKLKKQLEFMNKHQNKKSNQSCLCKLENV